MKAANATAVATMPIAIAINLSVGLLVHALKIPLYLDSIGTVLVGFTFGPLWAALVGGISMVLGGFVLNPWMPYYTGTAVVIGLVSGLAGRLGWQWSIVRCSFLGILLAFIAAVVSAPITVLLFGGVTGSGTSALVAVLRASGRSLVESVLITGFLVEILDKVITALLPCLLILRMPGTLRSRMPLLRAQRRSRKA